MDILKLHYGCLFSNIKAVYLFDTVGSTNAIVLKGDDGICQFDILDCYDVIIAKRQFLGKGRGANIWDSPYGNLYLSVKLPIYKSPEEYLRLSLFFAIKIIDNIKKNYNLEFKLKWPNDIMYDGKKIAGVLVEKSLNSAVLGLGFNVNSTSFTSEISKLAVSLNSILGRDIDMDIFYENILLSLDNAINDYKNADLEGLWSNYSMYINSDLWITNGGLKSRYKEFGIDRSGFLNVFSYDEGIEKKLYSGDVNFMVWE